MIGSVHQASRLIPIKCLNDRTVDLTPREGEMQASCYTMLSFSSYFKIQQHTDATVKFQSPNRHDECCGHWIFAGRQRGRASSFIHYIRHSNLVLYQFQSKATPSFFASSSFNPSRILCIYFSAIGHNDPFAIPPLTTQRNPAPPYDISSFNIWLNSPHVHWNPGSILGSVHSQILFQPNCPTTAIIFSSSPRSRGVYRNA